LAVASNSSVIVTDNIKDIEHGELKFEIEVLTPKQFIERYRK
jgi:predicted nucleic acid-binding protein